MDWVICAFDLLKSEWIGLSVHVTYLSQCGLGGVLVSLV